LSAKDRFFSEYSKLMHELSGYHVSNYLTDLTGNILKSVEINREIKRKGVLYAVIP
jgi:hypothetical protein